MMSRSLSVFGRLVPGLFLALLFLNPATAQDRGNDEARASPNAAVSQTIGTTEVRITYGRPSVNDREIFGGLVPLNEVWRTGANEATTITFSSDVMIEGESLSAGTYSLFTIPGTDSWTLIFNSEANIWGTNYDESNNVLQVEVEPEMTSSAEEMMTFTFENVTDTSGTCVLEWADMRVPFEISVADG